MSKRKDMNFFKKRKNKISASLMKEIWSYFFVVIATILISFVLVMSVGLKTSMIGISMEPNLFNGQELFVNRFVYKLSAPKQGDPVVFYPNGSKSTHYYIKRIIAVPGDTVHITDGMIYVNGIPYGTEKYDKVAQAGIAENEITLASDEYFVLGDNVNNSEDSRSANVGLVKRDNIVGKVWFHMAAQGSSMGFMQ